MNDAIRHRGPDDEGSSLEQGVGLANRRLAIIDLSAGGHQPMANEDGSLLITYNGEVYNFRELVPELESQRAPLPLADATPRPSCTPTRSGARARWSG